jgi:hydrogenase small subunit
MSLPKAPEKVEELYILWTSEGMSCDGDTVSMTNAKLPRIEDVALGLIPNLPKVHLVNKVLAYETGDDFMEPFWKAANDELGLPFIFVVEGSIPNEKINGEGYWTSMGNYPDTGEPKTLNAWIDELAPRAWAVVAAGTCATYGGIHAMAGNPTGCMGLTDYLGKDFRAQSGLPVVNVPGCPIQPDNFMETLTWLLHQAAGVGPAIPLDDQQRPTWLFGKTVHEGCDRAAYYEQADWALDYNSPKCQVKVGCWGPVVNCNVTKRGWMDGIGGCPNVGGICIACTMPGFPDKFMPFMDEPPGGTLSSTLLKPYGAFIRMMRGFTNKSANREPRWHHNRDELTSGYDPRWSPSRDNKHGRRDRGEHAQPAQQTQQGGSR